MNRNVHLMLIACNTRAVPASQQHCHLGTDIAISHDSEQGNDGLLQGSIQTNLQGT